MACLRGPSREAHPVAMVLSGLHAPAGDPREGRWNGFSSGHLNLPGNLSDAARDRYAADRSCFHYLVQRWSH